jgi:hypothetical protein
MQENSSLNEDQKLYSIKEVAENFNIRSVGSGNLLYYLKQFNILDYNGLPEEEYRQYFRTKYGTKNLKSSTLYPKLMVTEEGLKWLEETYKDKIIIENEKYWINKKKKTKKK